MKTNFLFLIAALMLLISGVFAYIGYTGNPVLSNHYMTDHKWTDSVCMGCHLNVKAEVDSSYHVQQDVPQWSSLMSGGMLVKDMNKEDIEQVALRHPGGGVLAQEGADVDCLICHEQNDKYDYSSRTASILAGNFSGAKDVASLQATQNAQKSTKSIVAYILNILTPLPVVTEVHDNIYGEASNAQCIKCHEDSIILSGESWDDNNSSHYNVHSKLQCVQCHETTDHQIAKRLPLDSYNSNNIGSVKNCTDSGCHQSITHGDVIDSSHLKKLECQTCHIPNLPAKIEGSNGTINSFSWQNGVLEKTYHNDTFAPTLSWSKGIYNEQLPIAAGRNDTGAKLNTFNVVKGTWWDAGINPHVVANPDNNSSVGNPIPPTTVRAADNNKDAKVTIDEIRSYDSNGDGISDYPNAVLRNVNLFYQTSHTISDIDKDLGKPLVCVDCHGNASKIDWHALGFSTDPAGNTTDFSKQNISVTLKRGQKPIEIERKPAF